MASRTSRDGRTARPVSTDGRHGHLRAGWRGAPDGEQPRSATSPWSPPSRRPDAAAAQFDRSNERNLIVTDLQEIDMGVPDFAALYEPHVADGAGMTPRMACWLWQAALVAADSWRFIADREWIENALPTIAWPYAHGRWLHEYILGFDRIADRIAGGNGDTDLLARCTAEELALHEIIATAETYLAEEVLDIDLAVELPDHGEDDRNFHLMRDVLF